MLLKMFIGTWFIASELVDFIGLDSPFERQHYLSKQANEMYYREIEKLKNTGVRIGVKADFYIDNVQSKMNTYNQIRPIK